MTRKIKSRTKARKAQPVQREREALPWKYLVLTAICGLLLVVGFFGAARQHFASIDFGIRNSKLRKQVDALQSEQRRLLLSREVALSPPELKRAARRFGFREMTASNIGGFENREATDGNIHESTEIVSNISSTAEPEKPRATPKPAMAAAPAEKQTSEKTQRPKDRKAPVKTNGSRTKSADDSSESKTEIAQNATDRKRVQ